MNILDKQTGSQLTADEFNQIPDELETLISSAGIIPSEEILTQVSEAVMQLIADGRFFTATGSENDIVLSNITPKKPLRSLRDGLSGTFKAILDNTSEATINICNLGAIEVYKNNAPLTDGDIKQGKYYNFIYDETNNRFEISDFYSSDTGGGGGGGSTVVNDFGYTQNDFIQAKSKSEIVIKKGTEILLNVAGETVAKKFKAETDKVYALSAILDHGAIEAGKDYCIYLCAGDGQTVQVKASTNSTFPDGYTADNTRKIGGLHTLCVSVTEANAPTLVDNNIWASHPAIGFNAGDIIPNSVWCLAHRPISDPSGMVYVDKIDMWVDIYLQSGTGLATASAFGATVTDTRQPINHQWDMQLINKKLATDNDFTMFAEGSNQKTAISGAKAPTPKTSGGHLDTANKRMISGYFVEECCGYLWQWLDEIAPTGGNGFVSYGDNNSRGQSYGLPYVLRAGGSWVDSSSCGSRSRAANTVRSHAYATYGGRGVSRPLILDR